MIDVLRSFPHLYLILNPRWVSFSYHSADTSGKQEIILHKTDRSPQGDCLISLRYITAVTYQCWRFLPWSGFLLRIPSLILVSASRFPLIYLSAQRIHSGSDNFSRHRIWFVHVLWCSGYIIRISYLLQLGIQDFPGGGPTPRGGANL